MSEYTNSSESGNLFDFLGGIGSVMAINKIAEYVVPIEWQPQYRIQKERDERLQEFQKRQQRENQMFQVARDAQQQAFLSQRDVEQRHFQMEMEANRMAFQERIEMRRLQVQQNLEKERTRLTIALNEQNIENSQQIAQFNAMAMRETQILVARENAQNLLQDHMVQDALRNFPLNISPLVLLKNRPHSLSSLLRFTVAKHDKNSADCDKKDVIKLSDCNMQDVIRDVMQYAKNPEALNVFVAPVYVDSKIKNREILSKQIWDTTYQHLESFFIEHYNRRSERPVIFYPTAWNDKYSPGMHASETLHFFLRDMPCIVLEPRFDGNNFRIMLSSWGLGYSSTEHIRTELNFKINIDAILAYSVYERSKISLEVLEELLAADITDNEKRPYRDEKIILERNIKLYESLRIEERVKNDKMDEIDAFGIYKIFKIVPDQDLKLLSKTLSDHIGMTLATLTDIHHLRSTDADPIYPGLMKEDFPELYGNKKLCEDLFASYKNIFLRIKKEEALLLPPEERGFIESRRKLQLNEIETRLGIQDEESSNNEVESIIREYCKNNFNFEHTDFDKVWDRCIDDMTKSNKSFFESVLPQIKDNKKYKELKKKLFAL